MRPATRYWPTASTAKRLTSQSTTHHRSLNSYSHLLMYHTQTHTRIHMGDTNRNRCTQRLIILHAYSIHLIIHQNPDLSDTMTYFEWRHFSQSLGYSSTSLSRCYCDVWYAKHPYRIGSVIALPSEKPLQIIVIVTIHVFIIVFYILVYCSESHRLTALTCDHEITTDNKRFIFLPTLAVTHLASCLLNTDWTPLRYRNG